MIRLTWIAKRRAYAVWREGGRFIGLVRCGFPFPFRQVIELV